jgi:thioredoxin 1
MVYKKYFPLSMLLLTIIALPGCWKTEDSKQESHDISAPAAKEKHAGSVKDITSEQDFDAALKAGKPIVAKFFAPWCGPCKRMKPIFESLSAKYPEAIFASVNSDESATAALFKKYNVSGYPTFVFIDASGNVVNTQVGGASEQDFDATVAAFLTKTVTP